MNRIVLDKDYFQVPKEEDVYSDELDFYLDKIDNAIKKNKMSKRDAALIMKIILRRIFQKDLNDSIKSILGKQQRIKNTLFIQSSSKVEQYG